MMVITMESVNDSDLNEEHWAWILSIFGQSSLQVFQAYPDVFRPPRNFLYSGYIATGMWWKWFHKWENILHELHDFIQRWRQFLL
jgi:hypothetical protein